MDIFQSSQNTGTSYIRLSLRLVVGGGFEPPKASPTDLQSVPFDHSGTPPFFHPWSQRQELNPRPADYKSAALPTELLWPMPVAFFTKATARITIRTHSALKSVYMSKPTAAVKRFFHFFQHFVHSARPLEIDYAFHATGRQTSRRVYNKVSGRRQDADRPSGSPIRAALLTMEFKVLSNISQGY